MSMENTNPFQLLGVLSAHDVDFVVIGGHAVSFHGYPRATEDTDVIIRRTRANEKALLEALTEVNARWIADEVDPETGVERQCPVTETYIRNTHLMMLITDAGFLDIFDYVPALPGESVDALFESSEMVRGIRFPSLHWIRRMKEASGRSKDHMDIENLPSEK